MQDFYQPCPSCGGRERVQGEGAGPHYARLVCACGRFVRWLPTPKDANRHVLSYYLNWVLAWLVRQAKRDHWALGYFTQLQGAHPDIRTCEAQVDAAMLAGDIAATKAACRAWHQAWKIAIEKGV